MIDVYASTTNLQTQPLRVSYAETVATNAGLTLIHPAVQLVAPPFDAVAYQATLEALRRCHHVPRYAINGLRRSPEEESMNRRAVLMGGAAALAAGGGIVGTSFARIGSSRRL